MTTILTAGDVLLADIVASPADDVPRLIFADWCEENGQPERAEFVRVQVELAVGDFGCRRFMYSCGEFASLEQLAESGCEQCRPYARLKLREQTLLAANQFYWRAADMPGLPFMNWVTDYRRGFIASVRMPHDAWLQHGPTLVRELPLERVELTDREPFTLSRGKIAAWRTDPDGVGTSQPEHLRIDLFDRLLGFTDRRVYSHISIWKDYPSTEDAKDALSDALLSWARGITPLPRSS